MTCEQIHRIRVAILMRRFALTEAQAAALANLAWGALQ